MSVDHCHSGGHVRGLLCNSCNIGLGMFKDNIESLKLEDALAIVEKHKSSPAKGSKAGRFGAKGSAKPSAGTSAKPKPKPKEKKETKAKVKKEKVKTESKTEGKTKVKIQKPIKIKPVKTKF